MSGPITHIPDWTMTLVRTSLGIEFIVKGEPNDVRDALNSDGPLVTFPGGLDDSEEVTINRDFVVMLGKAEVKRDSGLVVPQPQIQLPGGVPMPPPHERH